MLEKRIGRVVAGLAGTAGSIAAIVALLVKIFGFEVEITTGIVSTALLSIFLVGYIVDRMIGKVNKNLDERLDSVRETIKEITEEMRKSNLEQEKAICRVELAIMFDKQKNNKVAIEKKAKHYFCGLGGNDWMGEAYSQWAENNGGDIKVLLCEDSRKGVK